MGGTDQLDPPSSSVASEDHVRLEESRGVTPQSCPPIVECNPRERMPCRGDITHTAGQSVHGLLDFRQVLWRTREETQEKISFGGVMLILKESSIV